MSSHRFHHKKYWIWVTILHWFREAPGPTRCCNRKIVSLHHAERDGLALSTGWGQSHCPVMSHLIYSTLHVSFLTLYTHPFARREHYMVPNTNQKGKKKKKSHQEGHINNKNIHCWNTATPSTSVFSSRRWDTPDPSREKRGYPRAHSIPSAWETELESSGFISDRDHG